MRWFKHYTNSRRDPFIQELRRKLGKQGIANWYNVVETVTEKYSQEGEDFIVRMHESDWLRETQIHPNAPDHLRELLQIAKDHCKATCEWLEGNLTIGLVEIIEIADESSRKRRNESGKAPEQRIEEIKKETRTDQEKSLSREAPRGRTKQSGRSTKIWESYKAAMIAKYRTEPVRNAKVNSLCCQLFDRLGEEDAIEVVSYYVQSDNRFYQQRGHALDLCVRDAETLKLESDKGRPLTTMRDGRADVFGNIPKSKIGYRHNVNANDEFDAIMDEVERLSALKKSESSEDLPF